MKRFKSSTKLVKFLKFLVCRNFLCLVFAIKILFSCHEIETKEISCEKVTDFAWGGSVGTVPQCWVEQAVIDTSGFIFSTAYNESIGGLYFGGNKNVNFLPNFVAEKFPNLLLYGADYCAIKEVMKQNFKGLNKLKKLYLNNNQIEKVVRGTFEDLVDLEALWLSKKND
jgi:Leucine-rich repeat (LRR) protein